MAVTRYGWILALVVGCGGSSTLKADVFEDDFEDGDERRATANSDELSSAVDIAATVALEYDLPYTVFIDGAQVGTGRMWRTPAKSSSDVIVSGVEMQITNQAGRSLTLREEHHFDAQSPYELVRTFDGARAVDVNLPDDSSVNALALINRVYDAERLRRGMWHKGRVYDADTNTVAVETTVVRKLGWAEIDDERVRVLWIDHRTSDGRGASTVLLSNGVTAYHQRNGVEMQLVGSRLDNR
jgi:hypothetical protein